MSKRSQIKVRYDLLLSSLIIEYQEAYEEYKREVKKGIDMSWIDSEGSFCLLGDANNSHIEEAKKRVEKAQMKYKLFLLEHGIS